MIPKFEEMCRLNTLGGGVPDRVIRFGGIERVVQCRCGEKGREGVLVRCGCGCGGVGDEDEMARYVDWRCGSASTPDAAKM